MSNSSSIKNKRRQTSSPTASEVYPKDKIASNKRSRVMAKTDQRSLSGKIIGQKNISSADCSFSSADCSFSTRSFRPQAILVTSHLLQRQAPNWHEERFLLFGLPQQFHRATPHLHLHAPLQKLGTALWSRCRRLVSMWRRMVVLLEFDAVVMCVCASVPRRLALVTKPAACVLEGGEGDAEVVSSEGLLEVEEGGEDGEGEAYDVTMVRVSRTSLHEDAVHGAREVEGVARKGQSNPRDVGSCGTE
eukprot:768619-Hanusia_phi.AAC.4